MRTFFSGVRQGLAVFTLLVVIAAPAAMGDDENPYEPPDARIKPPVGGSSEPAPSFFIVFVNWLRVHVGIHLPID